MADTPRHHRQKDLLAYAQDFLEEDERRELEEHLKGCDDCQKTLEEVRRFLPALQQALTPNEPSTEELMAKVREQMRNRPPPKEPFFTRMRVAVMTGSAALATTVLIVAQPLLHQTEAGGIAGGNQADAGEERMLASPHPQHDALDAGPDAGMGPEGGAGP